MTCWGLTTGNAGMVAQVKALAHALGVIAEMKQVDLRKPFRWLPNQLYASPLRQLIVPHLLAADGDQISQPLPELVISCGRRAALVAMGLRAHHHETRFIHIQDPHVNPRYFDLVIAMAHDAVTGPNVIKTRFALHAVTPDTLASARRVWQPRFAAYPVPRVAVLLGGTTNKYTFDEKAMGRVIGSLKQLLAGTNASLLITPSRRTGDANIRRLQQAFAGDKRVYIYDFTGDNPYMGLLAVVDAIVASNDSVNMMSEACATGKPLYLLALAGHADTKPSRFADALVNEGAARWISDTMEKWDYALSDEMADLAKEVRKRIKP